MESVRTCIGCRTREPTSSLRRVVAQGGEVVPDPSATLPGRGAWVHLTVQCVEQAAKRRAFGRALRVSMVLGTAALFNAVHVNTVGAGQAPSTEQAD